MCDLTGKTATLITPYQGYSNIEIIGRGANKCPIFLNYFKLTSIKSPYY